VSGAREQKKSLIAAVSNSQSDWNWLMLSVLYSSHKSRRPELATRVKQQLLLACI